MNYQNVDDKLIWECVERECFAVLRFKINTLQILVVAKRLYLKNSKKHIDKKRKNKEEMEGVHDNSRRFIKKTKKTNS